ncbi:hypothetical protein [Pseudoalteromonas sp. SWN166]|uniref:hypothetical protein n=1 Tax=Pseudoalteromonas sp. SWN166 TaxID=2792061 RepID=UPI0018CE7593|nr:hypothetical protein [Pseudoalteromonas sp. SWN166]MBH0037755.1 hypothetical protein [Pseudoalteromonas sp. SWN166]
MMHYVFTNTERNNFKASVFETKSLLYLATQSPKYKKISILTIDCFNDVSGMCDEENLWDIQAKNEKNLTPRKIGKYLITLYNNYISEFKPFFKEFIFFMPHLKEDYVEEPSLSCYDIKNFKETHKQKLIAGLKAKASLSDDINLKGFFDRILFVEDRSEEKMYVKGLMRFQSSKLDDDKFFKAIFTEIRDKQTALKNSEIENIRIEQPIDVLTLDRSLKTEQLQVFVLNRFVGGDVFSNSRKCPASYIRFTRRFHDEDDIEDHIYEQNAALSRAFFNKNNQINFWCLFEAIFKEFCEDKNKKVTDVVSNIRTNLIDKVEHMDSDSTLFLVAMVRDGLINDN